MTSPSKLNDPFADARMRILGTQRFAYLYGADRDEGFVPDPEKQGRATDILTLNDLRVPFTFMHVRKNYFRQKLRHELKPFDCIVNGVTNPDTNPRVLEVMERMLKPYKGRVINPPSTVLDSTRDKVSRRLRSIEGMVTPSTVRLKSGSRGALANIVEREGITFPAIFRRAGAHRGVSTFLVNGLDQVAQGLESGHDFYLISFVNFRSPDGLYRKIRFFFIGEAVIIRHQVVSDNWNVHVEARDRFMATRPRLIEEERDLLAGGIESLPALTQATLARVREAMGLDFFGLDCSLMEDGRLVLFEANATMNFSNASLDDPRFSYFRQTVQQGRAGFRSMLRADYDRRRTPPILSAA
jgi:glutathione synthase/RimK-type ligase-like ATP-grasp enzyme